MKTRIFVLLAGIFAYAFAFAQNVEKRYFASNSKLGGDVLIESAEIKVDGGDEIQKIFEIESAASGAYYMDAWLMAPLTSEGYPEYKVAVNGELIDATFKPQVDNWQTVSLTTPNKSAATVKLKEGTNHISIIGKCPEVPDVEFIKLSTSAVKAGISDAKYKNYIAEIKANEMNGVNSLVGDPIPSNQVRGTNGELYSYYLDMPVYYTTIKNYHFSAGQKVTINTSSSNSGFRYVIEFFEGRVPVPSNATWVQYVTGSGSLTVTIPETENYFLRVRSYQQLQTGTVNLTVNGNTYSNCAVASSGDMNRGFSTNYIACKVDPGNEVWLFTTNADYVVNYDQHYVWDSNDIGAWVGTSQPVEDGLVSAYSSNSPTFNCDLYLGLGPVTSSILSAFPNLSNEAFKSGNPSTVYNCISWSVGITSSWINPSSLSVMDDLYESYGYTRSGANESNAAIALWANGGSITHASVRKNSTINKPHGFAWESKCGQLERVMHNLHELGGSSYGSVAYYYRPKSGTVNSILQTQAEETESFSSSEFAIIESLKAEMESSLLSEFNSKYDAWKETWNDPSLAIKSNTRDYAQSEEYFDLLQFCTKYGKATWPLFIERLAEGDVFVSNLLEDLTFSENKSLYDQIVTKKTRTQSFASLFVYSNMMEYSKKILEQQQYNIQDAVRNVNLDDETENIAVSVNEKNILLNVTAENAGTLVVNIVDIYGLSVYQADYSIPEGNWTNTINVSDLKEGTYIVQVQIGNQVVSHKISIK